MTSPLSPGLPGDPGAESGERSHSAGEGEGLPNYPELGGLPPSGQSFLRQLLECQLLAHSSAGTFLQQSAESLGELDNEEALGQALVDAGLLTHYQLARILAGTAHGLVLGNHKVLERLGAGSMGVVFLGEHFLLKRRVAIKVLPVDDDLPPALLERFYSEMRVLADLHHPNIVMAFDAGNLPSQTPGTPNLLYLVLELVPGGDLEQYVLEHGAAPIAQACDWIRQAACGLQEAHDRNLIHRDVKPSNLLLTESQSVKLVDFGLARQFCSQLTDPKALLGSIDYMAPEQSRDPSAVTGRADIYGLGATLFWLVTGQTPYPPQKSVARALLTLQQERPRRPRSLRPDLPVELGTLIERMMDRDPAQRPALPVTVMNALTRFSASASHWEILDLESAAPSMPKPNDVYAALPTSSNRAWRVLIVDDEKSLRDFARAVLESLGCICGEAEDGESALALAAESPYDLVLLDLMLPGMHGFEVCDRLREKPPCPHLKIIILSGHGSDTTNLAESLAHGADDYVDKPVEVRRLAAKVQYTLRLKDAQDRADVLARHLIMANRQLEHSLTSRASEVHQAQHALLYGLAKVAELRDGETPGHLLRLQMYTRCLAERIALNPFWSRVINTGFLENLQHCVPLHDIGKIGLPDCVLCKPGALDPSERALMEKHTLIGAGILDSLAREFGETLAFVPAATMIVRYHHERYDGQGYPDHLAADTIPPAARLVALADVYDALRRKRYHKPPLTHTQAFDMILQGAETQFDPAVVHAFEACHREFDRIFDEIAD